MSAFHPCSIVYLFGMNFIVFYSLLCGGVYIVDVNIFFIFSVCSNIYLGSGSFVDVEISVLEVFVKVVLTGHPINLSILDLMERRSLVTIELVSPH